MPSKIKLIIFDLDGTLIDAYKAIADSLNFTMKKLGLPTRPFLTVKKAVGWGDEGLLKPFAHKELLKKALGIYRAHHQKSLRTKSRLLPRVKILLNYLKKKHYIMAIASNRPKKFSHIVLRQLKIYKYFDYILCASQIKRPKPFPDIINKIMRRFSLSQKNTLYAGDMALDIETGKAAGVFTVAVLTGSSGKGEILKAKPNLILKDISGLLKIL